MGHRQRPSHSAEFLAPPTLIEARPAIALRGQEPGRDSRIRRLRQRKIDGNHSKQKRHDYRARYEQLRIRDCHNSISITPKDPRSTGFHRIYSRFSADEVGDAAALAGDRQIARGEGHPSFVSSEVRRMGVYR